jgi:hypothetical protein
MNVVAWTVALSIRASRDIAQNAILTNAVTVLIFVRAIDRRNRGGITAFLQVVSDHLVGPSHSAPGRTYDTSWYESCLGPCLRYREHCDRQKQE